ncbi:MAG: LapA family protein [Pseudomonadota bacterium]
MKTLVTWLIAVPAGIVVVLFALANRTPVVVSFDPFTPGAPALAVGPAPRIVVMFAVLMVGFILGAVAAYASGDAVRKRAAARKKEIRQLRRDVAAAKTTARAEGGPATGETLPALRTQ